MQFLNSEEEKKVLYIALHMSIYDNYNSIYNMIITLPFKIKVKTFIFTARQDLCTQSLADNYIYIILCKTIL